MATQAEDLYPEKFKIHESLDGLLRVLVGKRCSLRTRLDISNSQWKNQNT